MHGRFVNRAYDSGGWLAGRSTQKMDPRSAGKSAPIAPRWTVASWLAIHNPSPVLLSPPVGRALNLANAWKSWSRSAAGTPGP
jgi:hypothetical protein